MSILFGIAIVFFVITSLFLVLLVLVQNDKGGGISGAIGGGIGNAGAVMGAQDTANILSRLTTGFAIGYMVLSIVISLFLARFATNSNSKSLLKARAESVGAYAPVTQSGQSGFIAPAKDSKNGGVLPTESVEETKTTAPAAETPLK